ncbi:MAG: dipeptidase PepV [Clostridium lundense]|nr:dipeptidase PepV [Clostridium lundense]
MELNKKIDELKEELIKSTQQIIRIKSVEDEPKNGMPFGEGVNRALEYALKISKRLGFKTKNLDGYVGYAEYGEGEDYVAVLGHLDVVPEGDGWIYPPYAAEIHDDKMYGRGTLDDKGPIMAALYGLKAIKDLNLPISKRVRIIFGTNEETGSKEMHHYTERESMPVSGFTPDAMYPLIHAEKGLMSFNLVKDINTCGNEEISINYIRGGQRLNMVPDYCEAGIWSREKDVIIHALEKFKLKNDFNITAHIKSDMVVIKSVGVSAHGSTPENGINAIMQLFKFLETLAFENTELYEFVKFMNKYAGFEVNGESFGVYLQDEVSGALSFNIGTVNFQDEKISMGLNLRYPVTKTLDDVLTGLNKTINKMGVKVENMDHQAPLYFPKDHPLIKKLLSVYEEVTGDSGEAFAIGGGTYAKEIKNIVAFGPIFPGKPDLDHQANEYIEIEDLLMNAKIYAKAIYELAK